MKKSLKIGTGILALVFLINFISAAWSFDSMFQEWDQYGVFYYVLPFLLVFALIFGILSKITILGDNKAVHAIIAAAIGLMAVITPYFPYLLKDLSSNLAAGLSILLAAIILLGLFYKESSKTAWIIYVLIGIGALAFVFVTADSFSTNGGIGFDIWDEYGPAVITLLIIGGIIAVIINGGKTTPRAA